MATRKDSVQFTVERSYTVRRPKFSMFRSVEFLDAAKLAKGSHTIELGRFEGSCCDCPVMGKVKNGKLVGVEYPKCEKAVEAPPKFRKLIQAARRKLPKAGTVKWEDTPVVAMTKSRAVRNRVIIIIETIDDCVEICTVMSNGTKICFICCPDLGWCIGPSDPQPAIF